MAAKYGGMAVNEPLDVSGLLDKLDKAVRKKDLQALVSILLQVGLTDGNTNLILKS